VITCGGWRTASLFPAAAAAFLWLAACQPAPDEGEPAGEAREEAGEAAAPAEPQFTAVTDDMLRGAGTDGKNWITYGGAYNNQRYSPLTEINRENVVNLVPRWMFQTGVLGSFENTPLVLDGVMYITTPFSNAIAVDARTGREIWRYNHRAGTTIFCCGPNNRGVGLGYGKVYLATLDARVIALDQRTGEVVWDQQLADPEAGYGYTLAPLVYKNMVIVGTSGAEYGIRGHVDALNAETGEQVWRWYTIPETGWEGDWSETTPSGDNLNRDIEAEKAAMARWGDSWQRGGASMWMTPALDTETETLFIQTGNPSPDLDGSQRPGDNLYSESTVALDVNTGEMKWYHQHVPHDVWDLDAVSPAILFDVQKDGQTIKALGHAGKTGWVYVLNRETGELITRSEAFVPQENMFAQPTPEGTRMLPGANGGSEWSPAAYSPQTGDMYVVALHQPMTYSNQFAPYEKGKLWLGGAFTAIPDEEQWGNVSAIDVATGRITWQKQTEGPMIGGAMATAGGLVFTGEGNGLFKAYDAETGEVLWQFQAGAGVNSAPMSFEQDGEQFIAVAAGGNFQLNYPLGDTVLVFGLPRAVKPAQPADAPRSAARPAGEGQAAPAAADTGAAGEEGEGPEAEPERMDDATGQGGASDTGAAADTGAGAGQ
jgi:PQQ-dependent dehydrogenase (methanol/ethanol family)